MARQSASFFDLHIEKLVLGLCALVLAVTVVFCFVIGRFKANDLGPADLCKAAGEQAASAARAVSNARLPEIRPNDAKSKEDPIEQLKKWFGSEAEGLTRIAGIQPRLPRTQRFPSLFVSTLETAPEDRHHLVRLVAPGVPIVTTGRTLFALPTQKPDLDRLVRFDSRSGAAKESVRSWVSVGAQVDLIEQDANFRAARYPAHGSCLSVVAVHLQRKDQTEPWRGWQDVETYLPFETMHRPLGKGGSILLAKTSEFREQVDLCCEHIARPRMPERLSGDRIEYPPIPYLDSPPRQSSAGGQRGQSEAEPKAPVGKWISLAKKALAGKKPFKEVDLDAAYILARAAAGTTRATTSEAKKARELLSEVEDKLRAAQRALSTKPLRSPEWLMPLVAHDLDAIAGHTYVYRMRYEVLNIFAGNPGEMVDPTDADRLTIMSDWSPPSRPVTVESDIYFFLTGADESRREVIVTVFKKGRRDWKQQDYRIQVGEAIGRKEQRGKNRGVDFTTGAVCIDLDFDRLLEGRKTQSMVYLDTNSGHLWERYVSEDARDRRYRELSQKRTASSRR